MREWVRVVVQRRVKTTIKNEPKADSKPGQQSEGDENTSNVDILYVVVDKCL